MYSVAYKALAGLCAIAALAGCAHAPVDPVQPASKAAQLGPESMSSGGEATQVVRENRPPGVESGADDEAPGVTGAGSGAAPREGTPAQEPAAGTGVSVEAPDVDEAPAPDTVWTEDDAMRLMNIREEVRTIITLQMVLSWYSSTQGEEAMISETYRGHETLFSQETLQLIDRALEREDLEPDEIRALQYLKMHVALEYINLRAAPFDDRIANAGKGATARLSWLEAPVPYQDLQRLAASEPDGARRAELESAAARVWGETLNPLIAEKEAFVRSLAVEAGYPSYVELAQRYRQVDLAVLAGQAAAFLQDTDGLYRELLERESLEILGKHAAAVTRADIRFLAHPPKLARYFPPGLELEAFQLLLDGLGLELQSTGTPIRVDDVPGARKAPGAVCIPVRVPRDIRLSVSPTGGPSSYGDLFHEGGHALHYANMTTPVFEFQRMGPEATTEGFAEFFRYVWDDPQWLKRYAQFLSRHDAKHGSRRTPALSARTMAQVVRHRVFWDLYFLRRVAYAKLVYEIILHGGAPELYRAAYSGPIDDLQEVYRQLFSRAYGFELTAEEALRFRTDMDDALQSADFARGYLLAHRLHEEMRKRFGADWYGDPRAGEMLRTLWSTGRKLSADEVVQQLGDERLSFAAVKARLTRLMAEAANLEK